MDRQTTV